MKDLDKQIQYRATKIFEKEGIPFEDAELLAREQIEKEQKQLKQARKNAFKAKGSRAQKEKNRKNRKRKRTPYSADGKRVEKVYGGGAPGLGKGS